MYEPESSTNRSERMYRDDTVFQIVTKKYLTLTEAAKKVNNQHLSMIQDCFIPLMKNNELFKVLYKRIMYGGSYYKGTKYGKPEEFDLDLVVKLPIDYTKCIRVDANHDNYGFVKLQINLNKSPLTPKWIEHSKELSKWLTPDGYLDHKKFRGWMESVFTKAIDAFQKSSNNWTNYKIWHKKSGPAFTMIITTPDGNVIDVDLVPCLEFDNVPLGNGYRKFTGNRKTWMAVGKPLDSVPDGNVLWRLCFYEQERDFLKGDLKPVIKMMKKFRDTKAWKHIASYYIETIFYHELENHKHEEANFLKAPKFFLFMLGLKKLLLYLEDGHLPYFWHSRCNLFSKMNQSLIQNYTSNLRKTIYNIDLKILGDKYILAETVLTKDEFSMLRKDCVPESEFVFVPETKAIPIAPAPSSGLSCNIL